MIASLLPVGSDLQLFTKEEYLDLVALDPNKSLDPLASKFVVKCSRNLS